MQNKLIHMYGHAVSPSLRAKRSFAHSQITVLSTFQDDVLLTWYRLDLVAKVTLKGRTHFDFKTH